MFGMVMFTQPGSGEDDDREAHVSPVGLEVTARNPSGSVLTTASGRTLYATQDTAEIRCLIEKATEERSPVLRILGDTGDKGAAPGSQVETFFVGIREIQSIVSRGSATYIYATNFTISTTRHGAQGLGDLWRSKMALLGR